MRCVFSVVSLLASHALEFEGELRIQAVVLGVVLSHIQRLQADVELRIQAVVLDVVLSHVRRLQADAHLH